MKVRLPEGFVTRIGYLPDFKEFIESYNLPRTYGLRINTLKIKAEEFLEFSPFKLEPVPWCETGFYYQGEVSPGKHPFHAAGLYYIQEPSAMAVAEALRPEPGEKVLDLCAAPGGKSSHLACFLQGQGLLVSNEIHSGRAKILAENLERMGVRNSLITNESPENLTKYFPEYFDRILVDAPCSGEGMFRKDETARTEWSLANVVCCALRQEQILASAIKMLKPEGVMAYSTCTFSQEENEAIVDKLLNSFPQLELLEIPNAHFYQPGFSPWEKCARLWPHKLKGEGHFLALFRKKGEETEERQVKFLATVDEKLLKDYFIFAEENLQQVLRGNFLLFGEQLYLVQPNLPDLKGLKIIRPGWHLGTLKKNRFEPSHSLALALKPEEVKRFYSLDSHSKEVRAYLQGAVLEREGLKGWVLVGVDGFSLGWGKQIDCALKNHYPKGLRL